MVDGYKHKLISYYCTFDPLSQVYGRLVIYHILNKASGYHHMDTTFSHPELVGGWTCAIDHAFLIKYTEMNKEKENNLISYTISSLVILFNSGSC